MQHSLFRGAPLLCALAGLAAGCGGLQAYEGERLPAAERAVVAADPAFSAGLPVQVLLRKVNDVTVPASRNSVGLRPGRHVFVVDCSVVAAGSKRRFVIEADVEAGASYRLEAEASAVACERVELRRR